MASATIYHGTKFVRRVVGAPLMAPVIELRTKQSKVFEWLFGDRVHMIVPQLERVGKSNVWTGRFEAPENRGGSANVFVNDAVFMIDPGYGGCGGKPQSNWTWFGLRGRYYNNCGTMKVMIRPERVVRAAAKPALAPQP